MTSCWQEWLVYWSATLPLLQENRTRIFADDWKCVIWKWVHTLFTGTHNKATDSRDSAHFLDGKTFIGGSSYIRNSFTELYLMKHRFGSSPARAEVEDIFGRWTCWCWPEQQWRPCQTHSHSTRHCVVCVSHKSHSRGSGWLKMKMLHVYAVAASIAFLLYMVILFSSNNNSLILLFTNGNPWLYHCSSFEICNCNHYSLRKEF